MMFVILSLVAVCLCLIAANPGTTTVESSEHLIRMASILINYGYRTRETTTQYLYNLDPDFLDDKSFDDFFPLCFRIAYVRWSRRTQPTTEGGVPFEVLEDILLNQLALKSLGIEHTAVE